MRPLALALVAALPLVAACGDPAPTGAAPDTIRRYGAPVAVGAGHARAYVVLDQRAGGSVPLELGVALSEQALDGLPAAGDGHHDGGEHVMHHEHILPLPAAHGTPFQLVELNWNPAGHEPPGIYDLPHFDFHFYTISRAERDAILPTDPQFAAKANRVPTGELVPAHMAPLGPPGAPPAAAAVPMMGVHWSDLRSPELQQMLGNPAGHAPFTATFIYGSWDGRFTFLEPMVTRAHILEKRTATDPAVRDQLIPISVPARYQAPGRYPTSYRIAWDEQAREYRIALAGLTQRE